jgi:hypothetical protein
VTIGPIAAGADSQSGLSAAGHSPLLAGPSSGECPDSRPSLSAEARDAMLNLALARLAGLEAPAVERPRGQDTRAVVGAIQERAATQAGDELLLDVLTCSVAVDGRVTLLAPTVDLEGAVTRLRDTAAKQLEDEETLAGSVSGNTASKQARLTIDGCEELLSGPAAGDGDETGNKSADAEQPTRQ